MIGQRLLSYAERKPLVVLGVVFVANMCIGLAPFFLFGVHPLGYDTGLYRRYLIEPLNSIPHASVPGLDHTVIVPRILLDLVRLFGFSTDTTLYGLHLVMYALLPCAVYFFMRGRFSVRAALTSALLVGCSAVVYLAYWQFLFKNLVALLFLFVGFGLLERGRYGAAALLLALVPLTHQSTTIVLLGVLGMYGLLRFFQNKAPLYETLLWGIIAAEYLYVHPHVAAKVAAPPIAIFIERFDFFLVSLPLLALMVMGGVRAIRTVSVSAMLCAYMMVTLLFPLLGLPYYQRILLFLAIGLACCAGIAVEQIRHAEKGRNFPVLFLGTLFLLQGSILVWSVVTTKPLLPRGMLETIGALEQEIPANGTVLTSAQLVPWVQGFSRARVAAPGVFKDTATLAQWQYYFSGSDLVYERQFLDRFPSPLYLVTDASNNPPIVPTLSCVRKIDAFVYRYDCQK